MTAAIVDRARLIRLCAFIREHQTQAREAMDVDRMELWDALLNRLIDRCPRS